MARASRFGQLSHQGNPATRVYRLTERTIDQAWHTLLLPEICLEGLDHHTASAHWDPAEVPLRRPVLRSMPRMEPVSFEFKSRQWIWAVLPSGKFDQTTGVPIGGRFANEFALRMIGKTTLTSQMRLSRQCCQAQAQSKR